MKNISLFLLISAAAYGLSCCSANPYKTGEQLYTNFCAGCHGEDGQGLGKLYPPIADVEYLKNNPNSISCIIRHGLNDTLIIDGVTYAEPMPGIPSLDDIAINNIANYVNYKWPFRSEDFTILDIRNALEDCPK